MNNQKRIRRAGKSDAPKNVNITQRAPYAKGALIAWKPSKHAKKGK